MANKEYPLWHWLVAAALAFFIGAGSIVSTGNLLLGPGMLLMGTVLLVVGIRKERRKRVAQPAA